MPQLTIITINRNNANGLSRTLSSILSQSETDFEYIVIDGASTDDSLSVIETFKLSNFQTFKSISEPDSGIYNAMNKGIRMATGEYLLFLNSGDCLASDKVIEQVLLHLNKGYEILSGELELLRNNQEPIRLYPPQTINLNYCINEGLTHPNTFIRRDLFDKYGYYNEKNKIISDWEFFLIVCGLHTVNYKALPFLISCFDMNGVSSQNEELLQNETKKALKRLLPAWKKLERFIRKK